MKRDAVWQLQDLVNSPRASDLPAERLERIRDVLKDHKIELAARPSPRPGVYGYPGAGPKQLEFEEAFFSRAYRIIAASGSNRSGKTTASGALCFAQYLRDEARNGDMYWVIAQSNETMRDVPQKTLWEFLPQEMFPPGVTYSAKLGFGQIPTMTLRLPGGRGTCELWFKTEEQDLKSFESSKVNGIYWTECTREAIFDAVLPRLVQFGEGGFTFLLMDYIPRQGWQAMRVKDRAETGEAKWIFHRRFTMLDNAHNMAQGEIEYQRENMSVQEARVRIDGYDGSDIGAIYRQFDLTRHVIRHPSDLDPRWPRWRAIDHGYRNPTAVVWACAVPPGYQVETKGQGTVVLDSGGIVVYREFYASELTVEEIAARVGALSEGESYEGLPIIDPTTAAINQANGKSIAQAYHDAGLPVRSGIKVNKFGEASMIEEVREAFEGDYLFFSENCVNAIYEHRSWRYKERHDGTVQKREPPEDRLNHTCDAIKLLMAEKPRFRRSLSGDVLDDDGIL